MAGKILTALNTQKKHFGNTILYVGVGVIDEYKERIGTHVAANTLNEYKKYYQKKLDETDKDIYVRKYNKLNRIVNDLTTELDESKFIEELEKRQNARKDMI